MLNKTLVDYFKDSIIENWELPALSNFKGVKYNYGEVAVEIKKLHFLFEKAGLKKGEKVAMIGRNSANWAISFLAALTYGAVTVPILPDFKPKDVHYIVNHSESVILFAADNIYKTLDINEMENLKAVFLLDYFTVGYCKSKTIEQANDKLDEICKEEFPKGLTPELFKVTTVKIKDLASIIYTSGTTGFSKGVMLSHLSLASNIQFARDNLKLNKGDNIVSFLPGAHAYGLAFEFLFPFSLGCHITFLTRVPSPQIITKAFKELKPALILSVPLVIEKIFKKKIKPEIEKPAVSFLLKVPVINKVIYKKILKSLNEGFGDNFAEIVIGGAALNDEIEKFFKKIGFRFTVGYGMTECGPLISYAPWKEFRIGSCGRPVDRMEVKIDSSNPQNEPGEILVKGDNVMEGYYKNKEATEQTIDKDGWLHTGDLGIIDNDNFIYIKGRSKNMILGPSGQNIYPEEIESLLNARGYIAESVVIEKNGKLYGLVYPDYELVKTNNINNDELNKILDKYLKQTNEHLPAYMRLAKLVIHKDEFEKTPKKSIKRFLYQNTEV
jgi:long-chain acyl-CoA synthetase